VFGMHPTPVDMIRVFEIAPDARFASGGVLSISATWKFGILRQGDCTAEQAGLIQSLWNDLPEGETARCHLPGFAIQAVVKGEPVFSAAICWTCNNVSIGGSMATQTWRTFDAESPEALRLLALCQEVVQRGSNR
jgi:hypothetical protein